MLETLISEVLFLVSLVDTDCCADLPEHTVDGGGTVQTVALCQEAVVKWMTNYTISPTVQNSGIK